MKSITSIKAYIETIMQLRSESLCLGLSSHQWFFRGQKDSSWSVEPNIFRSDGLAKEATSIQSALRQNPFEFRECRTDFEILTKLQHYGLGTRLLDVTLNPLVALYFATESAVEYKENKNGQYTQTEKDGAVFLQFTAWHTVDELCTRIAAALPFLNFDKDYTLKLLMLDLRQNGIISDSEQAILSDNDYSLLIEYIQNSYFVISSHSNERLIRQSGAFVLPTALNIQKNEMPVEDSLVVKSHQVMNMVFKKDVLIIPSKSKREIREELDFFNINEATMYPELEHQMGYIKQKNIPITGSVPLFKQYSKKELLDENVFNELEPDVNKIVNDLLPEVTLTVKEQLIAFIQRQTALVDWKQKESIRSQIRLTIKRILQESYSAMESKRMADKVLDMLVNPTPELAINEKED